jgi:hypothetical protein
MSLLEFLQVHVEGGLVLKKLYGWNACNLWCTSKYGILAAEANRLKVCGFNFMTQINI